MTPEDRETFALELTILAEVLLRGESLSAVRLRAYWDDLVDFPIDEVRAAIRACRRACQWFPTVAELIEEIRRARRERIDATPRLRPAPPAPEEQARVHALVTETVRKLKAGERITDYPV